MSKQLVIDGQLFQTGTWHRGMGKYSLDLLNGMSKIGYFDQYEKVLLLASSAYGLEGEKRDILSNIYQFEIEYMDFEHHDVLGDVAGTRAKNQETVDAYCRSIGEHDFLILSLFEDNCTPVFSSYASHKMLLFYDLIPYLFAETYLGSEENQDFYFSRFPVIFEADQIFAISQTTKDDMVTHLGLPSDMIVNIDGAPIELQRKQALPKKPKGIYDPFILFPSGNDLRKNNERTIEAFKLFKEHSRSKHRLLITSTFDEKTQVKLREISQDIDFTGNVSEEEIKWLFENAEAVIFPSLYEGLGLPVLEAIKAKTSFACSDIPVFREMCDEKAMFNLFDPRSVADIASSMETAISEKFAPSKYENLLKKYTWQETARKLAEGQSNFQQLDKIVRRKLAILCPHPRGHSTIAKVIQHGHYAMSRYFDIQYFFEDNDSGLKKPEYLSSVGTSRDIRDFNKSRYVQFDEVIYHIGNSDYHRRIYWIAQRFPGRVVLHDTDLSGLYATMVESGLVSDQREQLEATLSKKLNLKHSSHIVSLVNSTQTTVVHSAYAEKAVKKALVGINKDEVVKKFDLPVSEPVDVNRSGSRQPGLVIGMAGIIHSVKGLDFIKSLALSDDFVGHTFSLFGFSFAVSEEELEEIRSLPNVEVATDVSDLEFQQRLGSLDALINYRTVYRGETSYSTIEAMRLGVPVFVKNLGWYGELPDDCVVKIDSDELLAQALSEYIQNDDSLKEIGRRGKQFVKDIHSHDRYARSLYDLSLQDKSVRQMQIEDSFGSRKPKEKLHELFRESDEKTN